MNYLKKFKLKKKLVFVVGGLGAIGQEIVKATLDAGAKTIILDNNVKISPTILKKNNFIVEKFDVSKLSGLKKKYSILVRKYGTPDIFINTSYPKTSDWNNNSFKNITQSSFNKNIDIHLKSFSWFAKLVADSMIVSKKKGSIIQLSSIYGVVGQDLSVYKGTNMQESMTYSIIKGGINNLTHQMASYYGKYGIRVNALCAGGVQDIKQKKIFIKNYNNKVPLKRLAESKEIASVALFLASEASSYITGTLLMVDGGWTAI